MCVRRACALPVRSGHRAVVAVSAKASSTCPAGDRENGVNPAACFRCPVRGPLHITAMVCCPGYRVTVCSLQRTHRSGAAADSARSPADRCGPASCREPGAAGGAVEGSDELGLRSCASGNVLADDGL